MNSKPYIKELDRYGKDSDRFVAESKETKSFYSAAGLFKAYHAELKQKKGAKND